MDQLTENEESIKSSKIYFYAAPTSFALGNQNIQNQSCIRSSYPRFLSCASWNAAWRLLSPPLELIQYILPLTRKLYLNYGLSNSLNMFIFLFLALGLVHRKLIFTDSHSFLKRCFLQTSLSFFFFCWWSYFLCALPVCPDIFLHDKKSIKWQSIKWQ